MQKQGISHTAPAGSIPTYIGEQPQRQRVIEAMIECSAEKTYAATTIADIVKHASISRTTFYKCFPDKRACFDAALDTCIEALRAAALQAWSPSDQPAVAVRRGAAATLELMASRPALAQLAMGDAVAVEPAVVGRYRRLVIPALEGLLTDGGKPSGVHTDPRLAFGRGQVLIFNQIAAGRTEQLPALLPEIVYLALLPFAGHEEAAREARAIEDGGLSA